PPPRPEVTDLSALVSQVVTLQRANAKSAQIEIIEKKRLPSVSCDREQIIQVVTNLIQNALEAIGSDGAGGKVGVTLVQSVDRVEIEVSDNGPGVAADMAERLFEPYATNKPSGTGLGLAIAQRIAIEHGGELAYVSRPGSGAVFRLVLPLDGPPPVSEMPASG
ncbi:MAG: HAMP domain-containing sensor histidine kinase, partial [Polyangiaceae bacterium]